MGSRRGWTSSDWQRSPKTPVGLPLKSGSPEVWFLSRLEIAGTPQKRHKPEEIIAKLRQVDVLVSQGQSVAEAVRLIGGTQFT